MTQNAGSKCDGSLKVFVESLGSEKLLKLKKKKGNATVSFLSEDRPIFMKSVIQIKHCLTRSALTSIVNSLIIYGFPLPIF